MAIELQYVGPKKIEGYMPWLLPAIGFETCFRKYEPYVTLCLFAGRSVVRFRVYWNVGKKREAP